MEGSISILHPTTCGFGKVIAYELNSSNLSLENRIAKYETIFEEYKENFSVALETHRRNFPKIVEKIRTIGKRHKDMKTKILEKFSIKSWNKLSTTEKSKHSLLNCKGCTTKEKYQTLINAFPVNKQACSHNKQKILVHNMTQLQTITQHIYTKANSEFKKSFPDLEFSDTLVMVPELNLLKTPTYEEKRTEIRKSAQDFKKAVENHKKETAVLLRTFGTELPLSKRNKIRMTEYFETSEQCTERTFKDMEKIESGKKRKKIMLLCTSCHGMKKNTWR